MRKARRMAAVAVAGALAVGACGGGGGGDDAENLIEDAANDDVDVDADDDSVRIEDDQGEFSVGTAELPEGFPEEFPVPEGATLEVGSSVEGGTGFSAGWDWDGTASEAADFYRDALPTAGYEITASQENTVKDRDIAHFAIEGNGFTGTVTAAPSPDGDVLISVVLRRTDA